MMHYTDHSKSVLALFSTKMALSSASEEESEAVRLRCHADTYRKLHIAAAVFLFVELFLIVSDHLTGFYARPYAYLNAITEVMILGGSVITLTVLHLLRDKTGRAISYIQLGYYLLVETGILIYFVSDLLRENENVTNAFYNLIVLVIFAVYSFYRLAFLTAYIGVGTVTGIVLCGNGLDWPTYQLLILLYILFFACANYFRAANVRSFLMDIRTETLTRRLQELSTKDFLTGLSNRTELNRYMVEEVAPATAEGKSLGFLMLDIDDFKSYNDRLSHIEGDRCLREIGGVLGSLENDRFRVFRYGGEEFLVIGLGVGSDEMHAFAGRIIATVRDLRMSRREADDERAIITVSVGGAWQSSEVSAGGEDGTSLIELADKELYNAKAAGKNCYVFHGERMLL